MSYASHLYIKGHARPHEDFDIIMLSSVSPSLTSSKERCYQLEDAEFWLCVVENGMSGLFYQSQLVIKDLMVLGSVRRRITTLLVTFYMTARPQERRDAELNW